MSVTDSLDQSPEAREALGRAALEWCLRYVESSGTRPVYPPVTAAELQRLVAEPPPRAPQPAADVLAQFARLAEQSRHNGHPRMFGYVQSSGTFSGAVADLLASTLNQNVTSWRSAPAATTVELQVIDWIKALAGLAPDAGGLLMSGGSLATAAAVAVALRARFGAELNHTGLRALSRQPTVYASPMVHVSVPKAASLLGLGEAAVRPVPMDEAHRMRPAGLDAVLEADRRAGLEPVVVVANAGDVNTGAVDPIGEIADVCARHGVWLHVDGAYGGFAVLAPSAPAELREMGRADSVALDPHKWLFAPLDAGCLIVRDPEALPRTFARGASYIDVIADADMSEFAFWNHGPELSRRFRALKLWFALKLHGVDIVAAAIEGTLQAARHLAAVVDASDDFERLAPVPLSVVCFRHLPAVLRGPDATGRHREVERLNAWNRALMVEVQRSGEAYPSNAQIGPAFALRACIVNHRTRDADVEALLEAVRAAARRVPF